MDVFREKDKDFDGRMSYEEFVGHETRFELAFKALDTNGDGFVSKSEFKKICPNMTKEQVDAAFAKFDKDKTGRINYTEFCSMLNKNQQQQQPSSSKWKVMFLIFAKKSFSWLSFYKGICLLVHELFSTPISIKFK